MVQRFRDLKLWQKLIIGIIILYLATTLLNKGFIVEVHAEELNGRSIINYSATGVNTSENGYFKTNVKDLNNLETDNPSVYFNITEANNNLADEYGNTWDVRFKYPFGPENVVFGMNKEYIAPYNIFINDENGESYLNDLEADNWYSLILYFSTNKNVKISNSGWFKRYESVDLDLETSNNYTNYNDDLDFSVRWYNPYSCIGHACDTTNLYDNNIGIMIIQFRLRSSDNFTSSDNYKLNYVYFANNFEWIPIDNNNNYKAENSSILFSKENENADSSNTQIFIKGIDFLENKDIYTNDNLIPPIEGDSTGGSDLPYQVNQNSLFKIFGLSIDLLELDTCNGPTDFTCHFGNIITMLKNTFIIISNIPQIIANMIDYYINAVIERGRTIINIIKSAFNIITEALEYVFIPNFENISTNINNTKNNFNAKFPTISSFIDYVSYIRDRYNNITPQHTINYNGVKFPGTDTYIIPSFSFDFDTIINNNIINPIYQLVRTIIFCIIGIGWFYFIHNLISSIIYNTRVHINIGE